MSRPGGARAVAAIVVNYNAADHLGACIESLEEQGLGTILVVDNASSDGSEVVAAGLRVEWVETGSNRGYGAAANFGVAALADDTIDYLLVCNPDVVVRPGAVAALVERLLADPGTAVAGPRLINPDGSLYPSARTFPDMVDAMGHGLLGQVLPGNRFTRRYRLLDWDHRDARAVDWVSGACFLVSTEAWKAVGGFDDAYFMYLEDVDLCWRLGRAGWRVVYEPAAEVIHVQGVSTDRHPYRMLAAHHRSMWRFAYRTTTGARRAMLPIVAVGLAGRLGVACLRRRLAGPLP